MQILNTNQYFLYKLWVEGTGEGGGGITCTNNIAFRFCDLSHCNGHELQEDSECHIKNLKDIVHSDIYFLSLISTVWLIHRLVGWLVH